MSTKLYVGNLASSTGEEALRALFGQSGQVMSCDLVHDKFTGQPRGFAFVEMSSAQEAIRAVEQFNAYDLDGRKLVVNEARPMERRPGGFSGRPAGGGHDGQRKSGKGSRRGSRNAKRERKAFR